jgi:hypothetical protein
MDRCRHNINSIVKNLYQDVKKHSLYWRLPFFSTIIITVVLLLAGGVYFFTFRANSATPNKIIRNQIKERVNDKYISSEDNSTPGIIATPAVTPHSTYKPYPTVADSIPSDWTYVTSQACNVAFPLPPKKLPYHYKLYTSKGSSPSSRDDIGSERFWQFEEYGSEAKTTARIILRAANEGGSGFVSGAVEVKCWPNTDYTTSSWASHMEQEIQGGSAKAKSRQVTSKWGKYVIAIHFEGGLYGISGDDYYYFFATEKYAYEIRKVVGSTTRLTIDTTNQILNKLVILD